MIIVSQDKKAIVNFENIEFIYVKENPNQYAFSICVKLVQNEAILGFYATEERTKEVLQEIIGMYQASKMFMATKGVLTQEEMWKAMLEKGKLAFVYEMPKK